MTFLNPLILLGLAAAAIPILIHLFNLRRPRRVDFSSLQFLRELDRRTMRRMRLRQWLLLALRTLAIVFLVMAFARPTVESAWAGLLGARAETATALIIDDSRSMTVRDSQGELLTQARELAAALVESRRPGDELFLLTTTRGALRERPFRQPATALDVLEEIEPRAGSPRLGAVLEQAFAALDQAGPLRREVVLISDLRARTFADSVRVPAPEGTRLTLLPLGDRRQTNTAVLDARVVSRVLEADRPAVIEATLVHHGPRPADGVQLSLFIEGEPAAQRAVELRPGIPATVQLTAAPRSRGWLAAEVRIEPDEFPYDDTRHLVLHVPETRRVLVVQGEGQRADLLELALTLGRIDDGRFQVALIAEDRLAGQALADYDVAILAGPGSLATGERAALVRFVAEGGGLMLFPRSEQNAALGALVADLGGGTYGDRIGHVGGREPVARFGEVDLQHPLLAGLLDEASGRTPRLESPELVAVAPPQPTAGQTVIALAGGQPFLHELRHGQGTVLAFAAAPDPRWGDFPTRGLFAPLLHRAVYFLAADARDEAALIAGRGGAVRLPGASEGLRIRGPNGLELVPDQRSVPGGVVLDLPPEVEAPGVYSIVHGERIVRRIAVNEDPRQGDLRALAPSEAARYLQELTGAEVAVLEARGGRGLQAAQNVAAGRAGVELWSLFLVLGLLCLLAEQLVAMRWRGTPLAAPAGP